jgi:hypothetical protein
MTTQLPAMTPTPPIADEGRGCCPPQQPRGAALMSAAPTALFNRLLAKAIPEPNSGCLLWFGKADRQGYGRVRVGRKHLFVHRVSWEAANGPIPATLLVCHHCDTPACINPAHLFLGTIADNNRDCILKGRHRSGTTGPLKKKTRPSCIWGHEYTPENTRVECYAGRTYRKCRACDRARDRRRRSLKRGAAA